MAKVLGLVLLGAALCMAADSTVDVYSPQDLGNISKKLGQKSFGSQILKKYGNDYTMLAYRGETGSSELHEKEADFFYVIDGSASLVTGGKIVNGKTEKPGELRGTSIEGGEKHQLTKGSIVHIPAGTPHQLLIDKSKPFTYFVVKVIEQ